MPEPQAPTGAERGGVCDVPQRQPIEPALEQTVSVTTGHLTARSWHVHKRQAVEGIWVALVKSAERPLEVFQVPQTRKCLDDARVANPERLADAVPYIEVSLLLLRGPGNPEMLKHFEHRDRRNSTTLQGGRSGSAARRRRRHPIADLLT